MCMRAILEALLASGALFAGVISYQKSSFRQRREWEALRDSPG